MKDEDLKEYFGALKYGMETHVVPLLKELDDNPRKWNAYELFLLRTELTASYLLACKITEELTNESRT